MGIVADRFLDETGMITERERQVVKNFLVTQEISLEDHSKVMTTIFKGEPNMLNKILLVSGYLKRGVLGLALMKRWRVEYGVNPKQGFRRMAVPFRAKDVAAEKTEFGHPDLAIILTHLSYYYSGLGDTQMQETFDVLKGKKDPKATYSSWIADIPTELFPSQSLDLEKYTSLNMKDPSQKLRLFDLLRKHKMVIDFWLSHVVFPRESKQFPGKLVMTAWDLCYERQRFPTTGFSGTNDSRILLPLMITQQDLPGLQNTNAAMEAVLLRPENSGHKGFDVAVKCEQILESMKEDNLTVFFLVDAGALMLELDNEQIASKWLEVNPDIEAAVYFTKDNHLLVKCRGEHSQDTPFDASPFQGRLDKCGVFLDDQHTRGTDIRFPTGSKACVTLGSRMKRDKLIQACMRMRKLGKGHSVAFYLSREAHCKVLKSDSPTGDIPTKAVLEWVCQNTKEFNEDGLLYPHHHNPLLASHVGDSDILARQCVDGEVLKLTEMYGQHTHVELLSDLIPKWFAVVKKKLGRHNMGPEIDAVVMRRLDEIGRQVETKCLEHAPDKKHLSSNSGMMEEEQEKELEIEKETEVEEVRVVERPRRATAAVPQLHPNVKHFIVNGGTISVSTGGIARLCDMFERTTFWNEVQPEGWNTDVYATRDFISVLQQHLSPHHKTDDHLRPIQYLASCESVDQSGGKLQQLLVLSPFEVNELMPYIRRGETGCTLHMFSYRRTEKQDLLLNNVRLQFPSPQRGIKIAETSTASTSLLLASGNLYFISMAEQEAFLQFLGLALKPWSPAEKEASRKGAITKTGFLLPEFENGHRPSGFLQDPTGFIRRILTCWHPVVSEHTHIMQLLEKKRKLVNNL